METIEYPLFPIFLLVIWIIIGIFSREVQWNYIDILYPFTYSTQLYLYFLWKSSFYYAYPFPFLIYPFHIPSIFDCSSKKRNQDKVGRKADQQGAATTMPCQLLPRLQIIIARWWWWRRRSKWARLYSAGGWAGVAGPRPFDKCCAAD